MNRNHLPHISLLVSAVLFGINYWVSKWLTDAFEVQAIVTMRIIGALILFQIFEWIFGSQKISRRDHLQLLSAGFLGIAINQLFFFEGINLSNPVDVSIIHVTSPFFVLLFSLIFLKSRISAIRVAGLVLGAAGALLLILKSGKADFSKDTLNGNLFILVNTASYASYLLISKPLLNRYPLMTTMKWINLYGLVFILPFGLPELIQTDFQQVSTQNWLALFYLIVIVTFVAYWLSAYSLKKLSATVVSFYIYLQPLIVALIAIIIGNSQPEFYHLAATFLIFSGVYLVSKNKIKATLKRKG